jgi:hypothetical protein
MARVLGVELRLPRARAHTFDPGLAGQMSDAPKKLTGTYLGLSLENLPWPKSMTESILDTKVRLVTH